ncbi:MAG: polysaccharide export outer membrane protein [Saprospiraceae bacterium]|jgi:polysaccharide export outer membrane protein
MQNSRRLNKLFLSIILFFIIILTSCKTPLVFESDIIPARQMTEFVLMNPEVPKLAPGDKLTISIWGHNELSIGSINSPFVSDESTGRWVMLDKEGEVNLPKIGRVNLKNYNVKEAGYFLEELYAKHIQNPVINVRVVNHFVTILGEVNKPGKYQLDNEELTLVELLGQTEGYTKYAKLNDIQLIRAVNGKMVKFPINFSRLQSLDTQNALLKPGDIVYVPPTKKKASDITTSRVIPVVSILTGVILVLSSLRK